MEFWLQVFAEGEAGASGAAQEAQGAPDNGAGEAPAAPDGEEKAGTSPEAENAAAAEQKEGGSGASPDPPALPAGVLDGVGEALLQKRRHAALDRIIAEWERGGEALKALYPGFELKKELRENGEFSRLLQAGVSVRRAYEAANLEKILGEALRYAAVTAGKKTAESLQAQQGRVQENSVLDRAASLERRDVNGLTEGDILKILDQVSRGAKIKF